MAIQFGYSAETHRIAALENEVDVLRGKRPRNRYTCTVCYGAGRIDQSYHGSPDFQPCSACDGGRLVDEANARLEVP